jgi:hypothetical protein
MKRIVNGVLHENIVRLYWKTPQLYRYLHASNQPEMPMLSRPWEKTTDVPRWTAISGTQMNSDT